MSRELRIGVELFDLHYGWQPVQNEFIIGEMIGWRWTDNVDTYLRVAFSDMLNKAARRNNSAYTNKMLIIIAEPDRDDYWTCAWAYDGCGFGVVRLMVRETQ